MATALAALPRENCFDLLYYGRITVSLEYHVEPKEVRLLVIVALSLLA
jgi:hypothetical protein